MSFTQADQAAGLKSLSPPVSAGAPADLPNLADLSQWFDRLEHFIAEAKKLEAELEAEKRRALRTEQELRTQVMQRERALDKESQTVKDLRLELAKARGETARAKETEEKSNRAVDVRTAELIRVQNELRRYQAAWAGVIEREKTAQAFHQATQQKLAENEQLRTAYGELLEKNRWHESEAQTTRHTYERLLGEAKAQVREQEHQLARLKEAQQQQQNYENGLQERVRSVSEECRLVREELAHYKQAWAGVLDREKEAKTILRDHEQDRAQIHALQQSLAQAQKELDHQKETNQQVDRHAKRYQAELQHALVRIHSAEAKFSELNQEYQSLSKRRRDMDEEVLRLEQTIRERLDWQVKKDQERFKADIEKEAALDREEFRSDVRDKLRLEYEARLDEEKLRYERMKAKYQLRISELETNQPNSSRSMMATALEATGTGAVSIPTEGAPAKISTATPPPPPMVIRFPKRPDLDS